MSIKKIVVTSLLLVANVNLVYADKYIGLSIGQSDVDIAGYDEPTAYKVFSGLRSENFGMEVGYNDLGEFKFGSLITSITGFEVSGVAYLPLNEKFELFGKVGAFAWDGDVRLAGTNRTIYESDTNLTYGIGAQYKFDSEISLRADYQEFVNIGAGDVSTVSVGAIFKF